MVEAHWEHRIGVEVLAEVNVALRDGMTGHAMTLTGFISDAARLVDVLVDVHVALHNGLGVAALNLAGPLVDEAGLKTRCRDTEALAPRRDGVANQRLARLLAARVRRGFPHLGVEVHLVVGECVLHVSPGLAIRGRGGGCTRSS